MASARHHGRNGRVFMALTSAGVAEPVAFQSAWTIAAATDKSDVTAFGDTGKVYVAGLPDASGTFSGFWDDSTVQSYTAAVDGVARKMYLYPDYTNSSGTYWFGTVFADFSLSTAVDAPVTVSATWNAASSIIKVG